MSFFPEGFVFLAVIVFLGWVVWDADRGLLP